MIKRHIGSLVIAARALAGGLCASVLLATGPASAQQSRPAAAPPAPLLASACKAFFSDNAGANAAHPLIGQVYAARIGEFVAGNAVLNALLARADFVLLGETHDNPNHHKLQACLLERIAKAKKAAVVFEQIRVSQAKALSEYLAKPGADAAGLGPAVQWSKQGWPAWKIYMPIAEVALRYKLPILAGDVTRDQIRQAARKGLSGIESVTRKRLGVDVALAPPLEKALREDLVRSHCNVMPASAFGGMSIAQRYRDAHLANALIAARPEDGTGVLIAGNGHVRADRAVPWHLRRRVPGASVLVVAIAEVDAKAMEPRDYVPRDPDGKPAVDLLLFTKSVPRPDPCAKLRKRFQAKQKANGAAKPKSAAN